MVKSRSAYASPCGVAMAEGAHMMCPRCNSKMIASRHVEQEEIGDVSMYVVVKIHECPTCTVLVILYIPRIVPETKELT